MTETLSIEQIADELKVHVDTARDLLKAKTIPAVKIGRRWVALREDVIAYVRRRIHDAAGTGEKQCSENVAASGTSTWLGATDRDLEKALAPPTRPPRKNFTTPLQLVSGAKKNSAT